MRRIIFVVDDERVIADTLCAILRCSGYEARAFYEAENALTACEDQFPDLIVSDVSMPGMSGTELAVRVKERFPRCEVLLFTGQVGSRDLLKAASEKGYEFELLTKPVHPKDLLARVERAVPRGVRADIHVVDSSAMAG